MRKKLTSDLGYDIIITCVFRSDSEHNVHNSHEKQQKRYFIK